jgi:lipopolysaccharide export system permease protein
MRKIDILVLREFIPFFLTGVAAFTLLMVAVTLFRDILKYVTEYGFTLGQVGKFLLLALPQTVAYTFPMAVLFSGLLSFGRLSDTSEITACRAGGIGMFRIVLPALVFAWFVVLGTFMLSEKFAPQSTLAAKNYIQNAIIEQGISVEETDISFMDQDAGWLFAAASGEGNVFNDVKWWDFSRPGEISLYTADEGVWHMGYWVFHDVKVYHIAVSERMNSENFTGDGEYVSVEPTEERSAYYTMDSPELEMRITRTPSDILSEGSRDPEEMSLQELRAFLASPLIEEHSEKYRRKILGTYHLKIAAPFMSIVFTLIAAPLGLAPQRSTSTMGVGLSMVLVFIYYMLMTFSVKIAESGILLPIVAAWLPNTIFLIAGAFLIGRFYIRSA